MQSAGTSRNSTFVPISGPPEARVYPTVLILSIGLDSLEGCCFSWWKTEIRGGEFSCDCRIARVNLAVFLVRYPVVDGVVTFLSQSSFVKDVALPQGISAL